MSARPSYQECAVRLHVLGTGDAGGQGAGRGQARQTTDRPRQEAAGEGIPGRAQWRRRAAGGALAIDMPPSLRSDGRCERFGALQRRMPPAPRAARPAAHHTCCAAKRCTALASHIMKGSVRSVVDGHRSNSVLEWNSYRVAGGVHCARLKMAAIRRSDAPRARASCRRRGCVRERAGVPTPSLVSRPSPAPRARPRPLHVPQHVRLPCLPLSTRHPTVAAALMCSSREAR
ncbi:hypothetical protein B5X24_HaOG208093 [Helicoverpa armigera]|nr:hypothetical protein B5X24_HaOG208093 [Helicoverpa armigera]